MNDNDRIYITAQYERASDHGYLRSHMELTRKLQAIFERDDCDSSIGLREDQKETLFHQACEDVARHLLLTDEFTTSISVTQAQELVESRYNAFLKNPKLAGVKRAMAVH